MLQNVDVASTEFFAWQYLVPSPIDRVYLHGNWSPILHHYVRTRTRSNVIPLTRLTLGMRLLTRTWRAGGEWRMWAYVNNIARYTAINPGMGH